MIYDRGTQFTSHLWEELCAFLGCKLVHNDSLPTRKQLILGTPTPHLKSSSQSSKQPSWLVLYLGVGSAWTAKHSQSWHRRIFSRTKVWHYTSPTGQCFEEPVAQIHSDYCKQLSKFMSTIRAPPTQHHDTPRSYVEKALQACTHVFMKHDGAKSTFDRPYCGPFKGFH